MHFRKYCRLINNMFAFISLGGSIDAHTHKGIYVFKLHGQLYHYVPSLLLDGLVKPKFLQLYFFDLQHEKENRCGIFPEINPSIVGLLMENTKVLLIKNPTLDQRVYNSSISDEVAAIWIDDLKSNETRSPYIVVWGQSFVSHCIYHYYGCYDIHCSIHCYFRLGIVDGIRA